MEQLATPGCGDRIDAVLDKAGPLALRGEFPPRIDGNGDGMFTGTVTVTSTGERISGVTTPEADVYVAREGEIVATALPKDLLGQAVDLGPGTSQTLTARGTIRPCAAGLSDFGQLLPVGRYDLYAVVVVNQDDGSMIVGTGGPWPLEVS